MVSRKPLITLVLQTAREIHGRTVSIPLRTALYCYGKVRFRHTPFPLKRMAEEARYTFVSAIASRYGQRLRRFFSLRLRNAVDAPDLAQEVFLRLMRVEHHETIRSPEAYLFTVASHVLHQHTLRQSSTPASIDISEVFAELQLTSGDDPMERADGQQRLEGLERVLAQLPPKISTT